MRMLTAGSTNSKVICGAAVLTAAMCLGGNVLAAQSTAPGAAVAPAPQGRPAFGARRAFGRQVLMRGAARRLGLTDAQKDQLKAIAQSHRDERTALAGRMRTARQALMAATTASPLDEGAIRQRSAELASVQANVAVARARARAEMRQVLTPEQQAQLDTMRSRVRDRMAARPQR